MDGVVVDPVGAFAAVRRLPEVAALVAACAGIECHLVGGALRDHALGIATRDLDAVVAERGREIAERLAAALPSRLVALGGKDFAAYRLVGERLVIDLWDREGTPLADDLARRDFTVNSFALEPLGGAVTDPWGGLADLAARRLRATTPHSFAGDPLRVLRLARLLARLPGFTADPGSVELARQAAPLLPAVAAERTREEIWLTMKEPHAGRGLLAMAELGLYPALWAGGVSPLSGTDSPPAASLAAGDAARSTAGDAARFTAGDAARSMAGSAATSAAMAAAEMDALAPVAEELRRLAPPLPAGSAASAAWGALDLPAARFAAAAWHLPAACGSPSASPSASVNALHAAGYLTAAVAAEVLALLAEPILPADELEQRRFLNRTGRRWLTVVCRLGARAAAEDASPAAAAAGRALSGAAQAAWRRAATALCELARREGELLLAPPRLLTGTDLQALLGLPPGPAIGRALAALTAAQVDGLVRTREEAVRLVRAWQASGAPGGDRGRSG